MWKKGLALLLIVGLLFHGALPAVAVASTKTKEFVIQYADVNGDGAKEKVSLKGVAGDYGYERITVEIASRTGKKLAGFKLYDYANLDGNELQFGDIDGDGVKEILAVLYTGGTDGAHEFGIYSMKNNKPKSIKPPKPAMWNSVLVRSGNKYYVDFTADFTKKKVRIDITKNEVIKQSDNYMINQDGRGSYYAFEDRNKDGRVELRIADEDDGMNHADVLAAVEIFYSYKNGKWSPVEFVVESDYPVVK